MKELSRVSTIVLSVFCLLSISFTPLVPTFGASLAASKAPDGPKSATVKTISHLPGDTTTVTGDGRHIFATRYQVPAPPPPQLDILELAALDLYNPAFPKLVDVFSFGNQSIAPIAASGIFLDNNLIYLSHSQYVSSCCAEGSMDIWDAGLQQPIHRIGYIGLQPSRDVLVHNGLAYVASSYPNQANDLMIIDVTNPTSPTKKSSIQGRGVGISNIDLVGTNIYMADGSSGLEIVDVSNPDHPLDLGFLDTFQASDVVVVNQKAYIAGDGLRIVDVSNPISPTLLGALDIPGDTGRIKVQDGFAHLAGWNEGLSIADARDPAHPKLVASMPITSTVNDIYLSGNYIYAASSDGLWTFWYAPTKTATIPTTGGNFEVQGDDLMYGFAADVFTSTTIISHTAIQPSAAPSTGALVDLGRFFSNEVAQAGGAPNVDLAKPYTMTISYDTALLGPMIENTMAFYYWDGSRWVREPTSQLEKSSHTLSASPNRLSMWAILGESRHAYLPFLSFTVP